MSAIGCYALDLYCDNVQNIADKTLRKTLRKTCDHLYNEFPHQFNGEFGSACRAEARAAGWILRNNGSAICPKCSGKVDRAA